MGKESSLIQILEAAERNGHKIVPIMEGILPAPMQKKSEEIRVVIANADGTGHLQDGMEYQDNTSDKFVWSKNALSALKTQYETAQNHPQNQWLIKLFNVERGIYAIADCADFGVYNFASKEEQNLLNGNRRLGGAYSDMNDPFLFLIGKRLLLNEISHQKTDMEQLNKVLSLLESGKVPCVTLSQNASSTSLIHELAHSADNRMSESKLFRAIVDIEAKRTGPLETVHKKLKSWQEQGLYTEAEYYKEVLAYIIEAKTTNDQILGPGYFKKYNPLMNSYLENIFYPLCVARACGSERAEEISKSTNLLHNDVEASSRYDERINSDQYMTTPYVQRLLEHMKDFHDKDIPRYIEEVHEDLQYNRHHPKKTNKQSQNQQRETKHTTILEKALGLASKNANDAVIKHAQTEILRRYRESVKS